MRSRANLEIAKALKIGGPTERPLGLQPQNSYNRNERQPHEAAGSGMSSLVIRDGDARPPGLIAHSPGHEVMLAMFDGEQI